MSMTAIGTTPKATLLALESHKFTEHFSSAGLEYSLTFSAALVASNTINMKVGGQAIEQITYATDSDTTMAAIAAAIQDMDGVETATVTEVAAAATNDRVIVVVPTDQTNGVTITDIVVAAGASQATVAVTSTATTIMQGTPVELTSTGAVKPLVTASTFDLNAIGYSMHNQSDNGRVTVACRGFMKIRAQASGSIVPGAVIWAGITADGVNKVDQTGTPTVGNMYGWAIASAATTEEVEVILK